MSPSCPISARRVDTNMVRLISLQVALTTLVVIFTSHPLPALILLFDFAVRLLRRNELSPFHFIAQLIIKKWSISPALCDESPKRFALTLGFGISVVLAGLYLSGFTVAATAVAIILFLCAVLEVAFDFCIGCKLYYAIQLTKSIYKQYVS